MDWTWIFFKLYEIVVPSFGNNSISIWSSWKIWSLKWLIFEYYYTGNNELIGDAILLSITHVCIYVSFMNFDKWIQIHGLNTSSHSFVIEKTKFQRINDIQCLYWYVYVYKKTCHRFALQCSWQLMLSMIRQIAPICIWCTHLFNDLTYLELPLSIVNFLWNSLEFVFC